jgi:diaminohydroxyphosphoribosylaminopyrimidine deaminase/5-amino-6-(5-phosphoribosylamino)uracil reductase
MSPEPDLSTDAADQRWMSEALSLARTGLGRVWPNPTVGCLIVRGEVVVGRGRTAQGGRPHAEVLSLREAGTKARGATAYVTLEPCAHWGHTPPCTDALLESGVERVVIALVDPDPRTNGSGIERLRAHGVMVEVGLGGAEAQAINAGFSRRVRTGRPLVGITAARGDTLAQHGESWDAVAAHPQAPASITPGRVDVAFSGVSVVATATWWLSADGAPTGSEHIALAETADVPSLLATALAALGERGLTRLLVHRDDPLAAALEAAELVDLWL